MASRLPRSPTSGAHVMLWRAHPAFSFSRSDMHLQTTYETTDDSAYECHRPVADYAKNDRYIQASYKTQNTSDDSDACFLGRETILLMRTPLCAFEY